jgi:hypothetical protein
MALMMMMVVAAAVVVVVLVVVVLAVVVELLYSIKRVEVCYSMQIVFVLLALA